MLDCNGRLCKRFVESVGFLCLIATVDCVKDLLKV